MTEGPSRFPHAVRLLVVVVAASMTLPLTVPRGATAQQQFLEALQPTGQGAAPILEGWYADPEGTYTFSFGYFNFNSEGTLHIPLGENNFITPAEFDSGMQPTLFVTEPDRRQEGVFTVTVPASIGLEDVVWTLIVGADTFSVPGHIGVTAYELDYAPRAGGSLPPLVAFGQGGETGQGPRGIVLEETLSAAVGEPLDVRLWSSDPSPRPDDATRPDAGVPIPIGFHWFTHQGPAPATFDPLEGEVGPAEGELPIGTTVTFSEPGEYLLLVRVHNWTARDSSGGNQCCWTNGYVRVTVEP